MFNFIDGFGKETRGIRDAKIQSVPPLFNSRNILEWNLPPDKRFFNFSRSKIKFHIDIPSNYIVDNDVFSKLIENTEINLSYETITHKSSAIDNPVTNFMLHKATYDESYVRTSMSPNGWYDQKNFDNSEIKLTQNIEVGRRIMAQPVLKQLTHNNVNYTVTWHRYYLR